MSTTRSSLTLALATTLALACSDNPAAPPRPLPATNLAASLLATNNLGAAITFDVPQAARARVRYWQDGTAPANGSVTPSVAVSQFDATARIAVLGMLPDTHYSGVVETITGSDTAASDTVHFTSGALPARLLNVTFQLTGMPSAGYTLIGGPRNGQIAYALAFDSNGRIVWYRGFDVGLIGPADVKQQANGDYTTFLGGTSGFTPELGYFVQYHPDGDIVARYEAPAPLYSDGHDILLTFKDGVQTAALFYGYEMSWQDLSSIGGPADTLFADHRLVEISPSGTRLLFPDETYFTLADRIEPPKLPPWDLAHPNSIDVAPNGNYIVSWRNIGEVTSFDPKTSHISWRLGGLHSTLQILNDPLGGFSGQHCARMTAPDRILIFDNGLRHSPPVSRAVEYQIDTVAKTATLIWSFTHPRRLFNPIIGCAQRLPNQNTLITYAVLGTITEVDQSGNIVAETIVQNAAAADTVHRAQRIKSLYGPE